MAKFEPKDEDIGASDYRAYFDSSCLRVWHLNGKERTYRIVKMTRFTSEMISGKAREVKKQPKLMLEDMQGRPVPLPFLLNKTNAKAIAQLYGNNPKQWEGKLITLFTVTGVDTPQGPSDAIRIRNQVPKTAAKGKAQAEEQAPPVPVEREPGADDDEPPLGALQTDSLQ
jgi:hypothetical protein